MRKLCIDKSQSEEFKNLFKGKIEEVLNAQNGAIDSCIWKLIEKGGKQTEMGLILHPVFEIGEAPILFATLIYRGGFVCYEFFARYTEFEYKITVVENKRLIKELFRGAEKPAIH